jgi:hypothetical protein
MSRKHAQQRRLIKDTFNSIKTLIYDSEKALVDRLNHNYDEFMERLRSDYAQTEHVYQKVKSVLNQRELQHQFPGEMEEISLAGIINTVGKRNPAQD